METIQYNKPPLTEDYDGDIITQLPADQTQPSHNELQIVNTLFKEHRQTMNTIFDDAQDAVLVGILFVVFTTLPQLDDTIMKFLPITTNSPYFLVIVKAIMIACLFWLVKHFYLSRKNS